MTTTLIAPCGLDCAQCDAYKLTQTNDLEGQQALLAKWRVEYSSPDMTLEAVTCDGCLAGARHGGYCAACPIRACAVELAHMAPCSAANKILFYDGAAWTCIDNVPSLGTSIDTAEIEDGTLGKVAGTGTITLTGANNATGAFAYGVGLNWYLNRNFRFLVNVEKTKFDDAKTPTAQGSTRNSRPTSSISSSWMSAIAAVRKKNRIGARSSIGSHRPTNSA